MTADELAFYDALTKPQAIKDFYEHDELIAITKELTDLLRKNRTIDWQKKEAARAGSAGWSSAFSKNTNTRQRAWMTQFRP